MDANPYQAPKSVVETARKTQQFMVQRGLFILLGCIIVAISSLATFFAAYGGNRQPSLFGIFTGLGLLGLSLVIHGIRRTDRSLQFVLGALGLLGVYVAILSGII